MTEDHIAVLKRLVLILEAGQAANGISHDRQEIYAEAVRAALESRVLAERKQEPVAWIERCVLEEIRETNCGVSTVVYPKQGDPNYDEIPLFTHPKPDDASDAARYRMLRAWFISGAPRSDIDPVGHIRRTTTEIVDAAIDAAMKEQKESGDE